MCFGIDSKGQVTNGYTGKPVYMPENMKIGLGFYPANSSIINPFGFLWQNNNNLPITNVWLNYFKNIL